MYYSILLSILFKIIISTNINNFFPLQKSFFKTIIEINAENEESVKVALRRYLKTFKNFNESSFNDCVLRLFEQKNGIENFLHLLSYSGKDLSDLGQESACIKHNFSYYILSYNYNISLNNNLTNIFKFLENNNFYTGLCLFEECNAFLNEFFNNTYSDGLIYNTKIQQIFYSKDERCKDNLKFCKYEPYYTLTNNGIYSEWLTEKEKSKYKIFFTFLIIIIVILCIEIFISLFIYCAYNLFNNSKDLVNELYEESDLEDDEENTDEEPNEKVLYSNSSSSKEKKNETFQQKLIKTLYKYFSFFTNIIILTMRKSNFYNNKNLDTIIKLRILSLLLISFSTNFDVYVKFPSKGFYNDFLYKSIYFTFLKFASFGLDMYICLDGFEVMYKLMNYFKKNFYDKGKKTISFLGILKFYLFSLYKIIGYIFIFFIVHYFNRYYIYIHNGGTLFSYYSNNINNNINLFQIFNSKYILLSYFLIIQNYDKEFLLSSKMSLLFINEFYAFTLLLIIFYIGNIIKSKIYDYIILLYVFISYLLSYLLDQLKNNQNETKYTYNIIIRNIALIKFPHVLFNHYLFGAFTGLICFYLKDSISKNSMMNDPDKCPFHFCLKAIYLFDYLVQKCRKFWIFLSFLIQFMICISFTMIINININNEQKEIFPLDFSTSLKIFYYYESGLFILTFCFNTILFFANNSDEKNYENYSLLNLIYQINFSYVNTIYLMMYSYYCYFGFQLKLTYQNLWLITFGLFIFFCLENVIITIILIMPFKIIFKILLNKILVINPDTSTPEDIKYRVIEKKFNNSGLSNEFIDEEDDVDYDKNDKK